MEQTSELKCEELCQECDFTLLRSLQASLLLFHRHWQKTQGPWVRDKGFITHSTVDSMNCTFGLVSPEQFRECMWIPPHNDTTPLETNIDVRGFSTLIVGKNNFNLSLGRDVTSATKPSAVKTEFQGYLLASGHCWLACTTEERH